MQRRFLRADLAAWHLFTPEVKDVVDSVLLKHPDAVESLAANPTRSAKVFPALYGKKLPSADVARAAVAHPLIRSEALAVASRERRVTVIESFLQHNAVDEELIRVIAAKANPAIARELLRLCEDLPTGLRPVLALKAGGADALRECCFGSQEDFPEDFVLAVLANDETFTHPGVRSRDLLGSMQVLFSRRPEIAVPALKAVAYSGRSLALTAVASSTNLTSEAATAVTDMLENNHASWQVRETLGLLTKNPFTPDSILEMIKTKEVNDSHEVKRALAARRGSLSVSLRDASTPEELTTAISFVSGRYWEIPVWAMLEILGNPRISESSRTEIKTMINWRIRGAFQRAFRAELLAVGLEVPGPRSLREPRARREPSEEEIIEMKAVAELIGTDRQSWETFAGLLNEFDGSRLELAEISATI